MIWIGLKTYLVTLVGVVRSGAVPMSGYDEEKRYAVVAETRRRWSAAEKEAILADTVEGSVSAAARKHGVAASLVFRWRRRQSGGGQKSERQTAAAFVPVALPAPSAFAPRADRGLIEIELAGGRRIRVTGPVEAEALRQVIAVVEGR